MYATFLTGLAFYDLPGFIKYNLTKDSSKKESEFETRDCSRLFAAVGHPSFPTQKTWPSVNKWGPSSDAPFLDIVFLVVLGFFYGRRCRQLDISVGNHGTEVRSRFRYRTRSLQGKALHGALCSEKARLKNIEKECLRKRVFHVIWNQFSRWTQEPSRVLVRSLTSCGTLDISFAEIAEGNSDSATKIHSKIIAHTSSYASLTDGVGRELPRHNNKPLQERRHMNVRVSQQPPEQSELGTRTLLVYLTHRECSLNDKP